MRRLVTIPISHYCEKARWALERAGLDYREERHVQGIHRVMARRAGGGATVPVLVTDEGVFAESEDILAYADRHMPPARRLYPDDDDERAEVLATTRWLDAGLGPEGRRLMYAGMMRHRKLLLAVNNQGVPRWEGAALAATWPLSSRVGKRELNIGADAEEVATRNVRAAFDEVARRLEAGDGFLCLGRFTAADLTFAALSAAVVVPPRYGVALPQPDVLPADVAVVVNEFRAHPAGQRALALFAEERG